MNQPLQQFRPTCDSWMSFKTPRHRSQFHTTGHRQAIGAIFESKDCSTKRTMKIIEAIKLALQKAQESRRKMATFHSLVLMNADVLKHLDPHEFCQNVGVTKAYHIEFRKMIAAAHTLSDMGYSIQKQ